MRRIIYKFSQLDPIKEKKVGWIQAKREQIIREAIQVQKQQNQQLKPKEDYRAQILFQDILNREVDVLLYNTRGRVFYYSVFGYLLSISLSIYGFNQILKDQKWYKKRFEIFKMTVTSLFMLMILRQYRKLYKYHVEFVQYNTRNKEFTIKKRNIIGLLRSQQVPVDKLLYTSDRSLNLSKINYINIDNLECYFIGYDYAWKNKEFFSHLIQQNIQ